MQNDAADIRTKQVLDFLAVAFDVGVVKGANERAKLAILG